MPTTSPPGSASTSPLVRQRLRLGAVSPRVMALYRDGQLSLEQLMAFTVTDDHARQEQVWEMLDYNNGPHAIRRALTEAQVPGDDPRGAFVGAKAYEGRRRHHQARPL